MPEKSGPTKNEQNNAPLSIEEGTAIRHAIEELNLPSVEKELPREPQALLSRALSGPLGSREEESFRSALKEDTILQESIESRVLLACVGGIGTVQSETESEIIRTLMTSSPNLAALTISLRVVFEPHPDYDLAQRVARNYLSFLPVNLAKEVLNIAAEGGLTRNSWYREAFDDAKSLEFAVACDEMRKSLISESYPLRVDQEISRSVLDIIRDIGMIVDEDTPPDVVDSHVSSLLRIEDAELKQSVLTLLLLTGREDVVTQADATLLAENPKLRAALLND